ncbi:MAG: potassium transporter [Gammaproteobacteria bacterium]|nr:potassium transporter [Gammaproteobacteria bacterium]
MLFSLTMVAPFGVSLAFGDGASEAFLGAFALIAGVGFTLWLPAARSKRDLRLREGFMVVVMFWLVLGLSGAVPFALADKPSMTLADAVFESVSGLTTTGATVIIGIDELPPSILLYRQLLQWLGGMGIIVLAVAILPVLGIGGMQLYRAETPGPMKDTKLTPRITETAKYLWYIYLGLTLACGLAYWLAGMSPFDALAHSFSTIAIGGFSTHDASLGYFSSPLIEAVAIVFMAIAGVNFALHFVAVRRTTLTGYVDDEECRAYLYILIGLAATTSAGLYFSSNFEGFATALRQGVFHAVSISTTTGFTTTGYHLWPSFLPVMLLFASFIGGCAGSTGGGLKVIRVLLLLKQGKREIARLVHPNAYVPIKLGGTPLSGRVIDAVWSFFAAYVALFALMLLVLMATGLDQVTAFSAVAACLNNLGPGLGGVGAHYASINDTAKWILSAAMFFGRLEIFTLLVILSPMYWRE